MLQLKRAEERKTKSEVLEECLEHKNYPTTKQNDDNDYDDIFTIT